MTPFDLAVFALKLVFGIAAFLLIGYLGSSNDKRLAGAMLTFPVLNGIGLVASPDKDAAALTAAMMPMIALNGCLCVGFIAAFRRMRSPIDERNATYAVALGGALVWCLCMGLAPRIDLHLPPPAWIAALYIAAAVIATITLWSGAAPARTVSVDQPSATFAAFWRQRSGRVVLFGASLFALLLAAEVWDTAWVGRLSALPIVPLFVLAGLAADQSGSLAAVRDTVLLGPGLAMLFVLALSGLLSSLGHGGAAYWVPAIAALGAGWTACFLLIRYGVPPLAAMLDRRHA